MRHSSKLVALAFAAFGLPALVQAGVYSSAEKKWSLDDKNFRNFQEKCLTPLKQLGSPQAQDAWQRSYDLAATALWLTKDSPLHVQEDKLTPQERLDFAVCLLRVQFPGKQMPEKASKAIEHLKAAASREKDNFLIMSTLATAYLLTGAYQQADDCHGAALPFWGKPLRQLMGELRPERQDFVKATLKWKAGNWEASDYQEYSKEFEFYAKCEKYQRKLTRLRFRELRRGPLARDKALVHLDPLFDPDVPPPGYKPLRFVNDSGKFEPGKIADAEKAKIPPDAIEVVEQLLAWMPEDLRLFWLLGELFNAQGDVQDAKLVYAELLGRYSQIVADQRFSNLNTDEMMSKLVKTYSGLGQEMRALDQYVLPPPDISVTDFSKPKTSASDAKSVSSRKTDSPTKIEPPVAGPLKLDWQTLLIGIVFGTVIGFLIAWRVRDLLRRRQMRVGTNAK